MVFTLRPGGPLRRLGLTALLVALGCGRDPTAPIDPAALSFVVISGDNQTGVVGTELPDPLVIRAFQGGIPARGIVVNFHVTSGGGSMFAGAVITDTQGFAQDYWTLGITAGAAHRVEVRAVLSNGQKRIYGRFNAFAVAGAAVQLVFLVQPSDVVAGQVIAPPVPVAAVDVHGNIALSFAGNITLNIGDNPGGGLLSGTLSRAAVAGISVCTDLSIEKAGAGYTLVASSPGLVSRVSDPFDVLPAAAAGLVFITQPSNATVLAVITPAVRVAAVDAFGNLVPTFGEMVVLGIAVNPSGGLLLGTNANTPIDGVAHFSDLRINLAGNDYRLAASAVGVAPATSGAFNITP